MKALRVENHGICIYIRGTKRNSGVKKKEREREKRGTRSELHRVGRRTNQRECKVIVNLVGRESMENTT